jgi:dTDP-4-amino-4,6-dideoxygalactose transaminase
MNPIEWNNFPLPLIQVNPPELSETNEFLQSVYRTGIFSNSGELQRLASHRLAENFGSHYSGYLASSNTMALVACLLKVGVRGKYVIISNFTFAATLDAVILAGGIPILCDIDPATLELNSDEMIDILKSYAHKVAAVLPTRVFGYVNDMSFLIMKANEFGVPVIIDSAATLPSKKNDWGFKENALFEVFSLQATKVFGIGEGGLVVGAANDIEDVRTHSNFGISPNVAGVFTDGLNAKADEFTAARALTRLGGYNKDVEKRREFAAMYKAVISEYSSVRTLSDNSRTIYSYFPIIFETEEKLDNFVSSVNLFLMTRRYYFPTICTGYKGDAQIVKDQNLQVSESIARRILCLPVYVNCSNEVKTKIETLIGTALGNLN